MGVKVLALTLRLKILELLVIASPCDTPTFYMPDNEKKRYWSSWNPAEARDSAGVKAFLGLGPDDCCIGVFQVRVPSLNLLCDITQCCFAGDTADMTG